MLTYKEIEKKYKDEWIALNHWEEDEYGDILKGEILYHTKEGQRAFYSHLKNHFPNRSLAIRYTGNVQGPFLINNES